MYAYIKGELAETNPDHIVLYISFFSQTINIITLSD